MVASRYLMYIPHQGFFIQQKVIYIRSNSSSKTCGAASPSTRITWASSLFSEEPSLKLLRSAELQHTNSSPISNYRCSKLTILFSRYINYNSLLWLGVRRNTLYIYVNIYIYIYIYIYRTSLTYRKLK